MCQIGARCLTLLRPADHTTRKKWSPSRRLRATFSFQSAAGVLFEDFRPHPPKDTLQTDDFFFVGQRFRTGAREMFRLVGLIRIIQCFVGEVVVDVCRGLPSGPSAGKVGHRRSSQNLNWVEGLYAVLVCSWPVIAHHQVPLAVSLLVSVPSCQGLWRRASVKHASSSATGHWQKKLA